MRKLGQLPSARQARRLQLYLHAQGIESRVDELPSAECELWVFDEEDVPTSREAFAQFQTNPLDARFDVKDVPPPPPVPAPPPATRRVRRSGGIPLTWLLIISSVLVTLATRFGELEQGRLFQQVIMSVPRLQLNGSTFELQRGLPEIERGEVWRLFTPIFLHLHPLHLALNMYVLFVLGGTIERVRGRRALLWLVLILAPVSNLTQYAVENANFGGMSGVLYGLFGYMWMRAQFLPEDGLRMPREIVFQMIAWLFLCTFFMQGEVANGAHFGGLVAGMVCGFLPRLWRGGDLSRSS
ncbi:rhomboid family intramembrane serine protease [Planctomicrobium sp. SH664]|uniref:rhomboid family intramembrane serine protease n=1 Tax=Planctomicrobium sp. SH664 TaxID=3448125 RepID=UPI003F5AE6AB